jgi:hypothetical protein
MVEWVYYTNISVISHQVVGRIRRRKESKKTKQKSSQDIRSKKNKKNKKNSLLNARDNNLVPASHPKRKRRGKVQYLDSIIRSGGEKKAKIKKPPPNYIILWTTSRLGLRLFLPRTDRQSAF